jgi:hypothetical protein
LHGILKKRVLGLNGKYEFIPPKIGSASLCVALFYAFGRRWKKKTTLEDKNTRLKGKKETLRD